MDYALVEVRSMSGQNRSNFKVDIFAKKGIFSTQLVTGNPMVVIVLRYVV